MKLKGSYIFGPGDGRTQFSPEEIEKLGKYPFKNVFFYNNGTTKRAVVYTELTLKEIDALAEKEPIFRTGWRGHRLYEYKDGKLKFQRLWYFTAKQNFNSWKRCFEKVKLYKDKYASVDNDIVANRKTKILGFERLRYCNNEMHYTLPFAVYKPKKIQGKLPLVIFLHGYTNGGEENLVPFTQCFHFSNKIKRNMKKNPCIILVPSIPRYCHYCTLQKDDCENRKDFDGIFNGLFEKLKENYPIDEDRIYMVGSSNGAGGVWSQLRLHPDRYAAVIPMMGFSDVVDDEYFESIKDVAIWAVHAENDSAVKIGKNRDDCYGSDVIVEGLKKAGAAKLRYSRYKKFGHRVSGVFLHNEDWYSWMFEQKR